MSKYLQGKDKGLQVQTLKKLVVQRGNMKCDNDTDDRQNFSELKTNLSSLIKKAQQIPDTRLRTS